MTKLCDYYVINGPVDDTMESGAKNAVSKSDGGEECAIFLTTYGGSADVAYRVMRLFQRRYKNIKIIVTGKCKSAGTIMAIGANTLVLGEAGELGPLDVQIYDGIKSSKNSGLDFNSALTVARTEVVDAFATAFHTMTSARLSRMHAIESAGRIAQSVASALYSQIDPVTIGASQRSIAVAMEYGFRLSKTSNSISLENLKRLVAGYPAHSFCIDREEARGLFKSVKKFEEDADLLDVFQRIAGIITDPIEENCLVVKVIQDAEDKGKGPVKPEGQTKPAAGGERKTRKGGATGNGNDTATDGN